MDPPVNSLVLLHESGISSRLIRGVIVTHCHADHDSGALQWLLNERKLELITTPTIAGSFLRKYSALVGVRKETLSQLWVFRPAILGEPMRYRGAELSFHYGVHTIPAIGFTASYGGKSIFYSGDTCNIPAKMNEFHDKGIMPAGRRDFFLKDDWRHSLILHEAGVPPIHTPIEVFASLPDDVKNRLYLVHTSEKNVPLESGLKMAKPGVANTLELVSEEPPFAFAARVVELFTDLDLLSVSSEQENLSNVTGQQKAGLQKRIIGTSLPLGDLLLCAAVESFDIGETVITKGEVGEKFYIIMEGIVCIVDREVEKQTKTEKSKDWDSINPQASNLLQHGDFFGEQALMNEGTSNMLSIELNVGALLLFFFFSDLSSFFNLFVLCFCLSLFILLQIARVLLPLWHGRHYV